ncbi:hypothetical protein GYH30_018153 [Glycine max]|nr:hypothetical protein GYH30_018153 [Glycine max]
MAPPIPTFYPSFFSFSRNFLQPTFFPHTISLLASGSPLSTSSFQVHVMCNCDLF